MRRLALLLLLCAIVLGTAAAAAGRQSGTRLPTSGTVWAVERFDGGQNTLAAFDASTGDVLGVVPIGRRPIGVTAPHGTGKVYTADERSNQLSVLSKDSFTIVKQISTGPASFPHHIMPSPNGKLVYFGLYHTNTVVVVDTSLDEMVATWPASHNPLAKTHAVWITNDGKDLYATNDGKTLVVGLRSIPQMALMDTETLQARFVNFPGYSISGHEWLSANGKYTFIALEAASTSSPGAIGVVDNRTGEVLDTWTYPGGPWPHGVFYEPQELR